MINLYSQELTQHLGGQASEYLLLQHVIVMQVTYPDRITNV